MSTFEKAYGLLKAAMLMNERFESLQCDLKDLSRDVSDLSRSHAGLAERVARIEGMIEMAAKSSQAGPQPPRIKG